MSDDYELPADDTHWDDGDKLTYTARLLQEAERERDEARAYLSVLDGTACQDEQENGAGPCGVCTRCLRNQRDQARAQRDALREALQKIYDTDCGDFPTGWEQDGCMDAMHEAHKIALAALAAVKEEA